MSHDDEASVWASAFGSDLAVDEHALARAALGPARLRWLAAVVAGARGQYARAAAVLNELARAPDPVVSSLASSTLAAHRRQLGGHGVARRWDAHALARITEGADLAGGSERNRQTTACSDTDGMGSGAALADALLGLAADALAVGRQLEARRLLCRAGNLASVEEASWRTTVRYDWVCAEVELAADNPTAARIPAQRAASRAREHAAARHTIKSDIVLAAALAADPRTHEQAVEQVTGALEAAQRHELLSLAWPAARLASDLEPERGQEHRCTVRTVLHTVLRQADPEGRTLALASPWVSV